MKRPFFLGLGTVALFASGCSNDIDVVGDWKEIPIVYSLIDIENDSVTYFRIEKAFLPPDESPLVVAKNPDSLYYKPEDIDVLIFENDVLKDTLERVDLNLLGIPKDTGIFASDVNYAYRTYHNFGLGATYRLEIRNKVTGNLFKAETVAINGDLEFAITNPTLSKPIDFSSYNTFSQSYEFKTVSVNWREPSNGGIYDMRVLFNYAEFEVDQSENEVAGTRSCKTLEWKHTSSYLTIDDPTPDGIVRRDLEGEKFYEYLAQNLTPLVGTNKRRCAVSIDIVVDAAGADFAEYIKAQKANEDLVGGLYPIDPYTNVQGGYGIFSTRVRRQRVGYSIDSDVAEYISTQPLTQDLGFRGTTCPCQ